MRKGESYRHCPYPYRACVSMLHQAVEQIGTAEYEETIACQRQAIRDAAQGLKAGWKRQAKKHAELMQQQETGANHE